MRLRTACLVLSLGTALVSTTAGAQDLVRISSPLPLPPAPGAILTSLPADEVPTLVVPASPPGVGVGLWNQSAPSLGVLRITSDMSSPFGALIEPVGQRTRLRILNETLPGLAARSRMSRITTGVVTLAVGATVASLAFLLQPSGGSTSLQPYFIVYAGIQGVSGIINLAWAPARETMSSRFEAMPMRTLAERHERMMFGEHALTEMAADGMRRRYLGGVTQFAASVLLLGATYWGPIFNGVPVTTSASDYLMIGLNGVSAVMAVISMFSPSDEEKLRASYFQQVRALGDDAPLPQLK